MFKSLYFKIILVLVVFILAITSIIGVVMINSAYTHYANDFYSAVAENISPRANMSSETWESYLRAYSIEIGFDKYRKYYIIPLSESTDVSNGLEVKYPQTDEKITNITPNLEKAINEKTTGLQKTFAGEYTDYAKYVNYDGEEFIVYLIDSQKEADDFAKNLFNIFIVTAFSGLLIAIVLSYFLAKAFTSPLKRLTKETARVAGGDFSDEDLAVTSQDEIGELTVTFNNMKNVLKTTIDNVSSEKNKLETVFESLNDAVLAFDCNGRILHINESAKNLFLPNFQNLANMRERLTFFRMTRLLGIDDIAEKNDRTQKIITVHDVVFMEKSLDINFGFFKYTDKGKEENGIICVIRDTTVKYELDKFRREFVADVSHELRTPLTSIQGAVETVMNYPDMQDDIKHNFLQMASSECKRLSRIVKDLLSLSRLDSQNATWESESYSITELLRHICEVLNGDITAHKHIVTCRGQDIPFVTGDKSKIEQVLINILSNAIKYTPDGGKIDITVCDAEEISSVKVIIKDTGIGIPQEDIPRIFERFYRVEKARSSNTGGTGLGLAISKSIIEGHGGSISVESKLREGTAVTVLIPYVAKFN